MNEPSHPNEDPHDLSQERFDAVPLPPLPGVSGDGKVDALFLEGIPSPQNGWSTACLIDAEDNSEGVILRFTKPDRFEIQLTKGEASQFAENLLTLEQQTGLTTLISKNWFEGDSSPIEKKFRVKSYQRDGQRPIFFFYTATPINSPSQLDQWYYVIDSSESKDLAAQLTTA